MVDEGMHQFPFFLSLSLSCFFFLKQIYSDYFAEMYALANDREAVLSELVTGTPEFHYFHALHLLNTHAHDVQGSKFDEVIVFFSFFSPSHCQFF
jgi:hypothetical protein